MQVINCPIIKGICKKFLPGEFCGIHIDVAPAQSALHLTYSKIGSGIWRSAVFSEFPDNVANYCFIKQILNTFYLTAKRRGIIVYFAFSDRGKDIQLAFKLSMLKDVIVLVCLGNRLVQLDKYLKGGHAISKGKSKFSMPISRRKAKTGQSDTSFFEKLSEEFDTTQLEMEPNKKSKRHKVLKKFFDANRLLHKCLLQKGEIGKFGHSQLCKIVLEVMQWNDKDGILTALCEDLQRTILMVEHKPIFWEDVSVYELEERNSNNHIKMKFDAKYHLLRRYPGQTHTISKFQYRPSVRFTIQPRKNIRKLIFCAFCDASFTKLTVFRQHYSQHFELKFVSIDLFCTHIL